MKRSIPLFFAAFASLALVVVQGLQGCGDDSTTPDTTPTSDASVGDVSNEATATTGTVEAALTYTGTKTGPILLGLWTQWPPAGPPSVNGSNETPTLPGTNTVTLKGVPPGNYTAAAYMVTGADTPQHRMLPQKGDPSSPPMPVTVVAGQIANISGVLTATDTDAGSDAGDAAAGTDAASDAGADADAD
jgi:hypothetical protein